METPVSGSIFGPKTPVSGSGKWKTNALEIDFQRVGLPGARPEHGDRPVGLELWFSSAARPFQW